jgi:hypothetical protein
MKTFCALWLWLLVALPVAFAKERHCIFRVHVQGNPQDTAVFSTSVRAQLSGKEVAIEKMPWISERDVIAFSPYPAANGTYGALFQLDEHGRVVLDTLSIERRGLIFSYSSMGFNHRACNRQARFRRKIYAASGLTAADIDLMKKIGGCLTSANNRPRSLPRQVRSPFSYFSMMAQTERPVLDLVRQRTMTLFSGPRVNFTNIERDFKGVKSTPWGGVGLC